MSQEFKPYVSPESNLPEFTLRALLIGLFLCLLLGAANAYLGLKAGMTIAATYPAAVLGMAMLRLFKGNILEENFTRTVGSIGESVAAGAIFTIPAFLIGSIWTPEYFGGFQGYIKSTVIMLVGGVVGILFVTLLRRVMVEDPELKFPESVAASEIHKSGQGGATGAKYLFYAMGIGALIQSLVKFGFLAEQWQKFSGFLKKIIPGTVIKSGVTGVGTGGGFMWKTPALSPAFLGVGYIIGPKLASLNFAGGVLSWGLFIPLLTLLLGPQFVPYIDSGLLSWTDVTKNIFQYIVKPVAIGGMLMSAAFTLFRMRKSLLGGIKRSVDDVKKAATSKAATKRTDKDINIKVVFAGLLALSVVTFVVYWWFMNFTANTLAPALVAALVMLVAGFFFAAVSGFLVGLIGSSNNPISGLTLSTLVVAAVMMVMLGAKGTEGVTTVLAVAGVLCVAVAVAGEMLQDLKVGHILGGTPWKMQVGDLIGVVAAALFMWVPLFFLNAGDLKVAKLKGYIGGFGGDVLSAPQAGLMANLSKGIVGGEMVWPLIIVGMLMAVAFILVQVRSPMLVCVGMYLSFETVAAIFVGGVIRWVLDTWVAKRKFNDNQKARVENNGVLVASGLIAGEAIIGLLFAAIAFFNDGKIPNLSEKWLGVAEPSFLISGLVFIALGYILVKIPLGNAGKPEDPAAPAAM